MRISHHNSSRLGVLDLLCLAICLFSFRTIAGNGPSRPAGPDSDSDHDVDLEAGHGPRFPTSGASQGGRTVQSTETASLAPDLPHPLQGLRRDYFQPVVHPQRTNEDHTVTQHLNIVTHQPPESPRHDHPPPALPPASHQPRSYAQAVKDGVKKCLGPSCTAAGNWYNGLGKERVTYDSVVSPARIASGVAAGGAGLIGYSIHDPTRINLGNAILGAIASSYATHNLGQGNVRPTARAQKEQYHAVSCESLLRDHVVQKLIFSRSHLAQASCRPKRTHGYRVLKGSSG